MQRGWYGDMGGNIFLNINSVMRYNSHINQHAFSLSTFFLSLVYFVGNFYLWLHYVQRHLLREKEKNEKVK